LVERDGAGGGHGATLIASGRRTVALATAEAALTAVLRLRRAMRNSRDHFMLAEIPIVLAGTIWVIAALQQSA
jgi:NAD(P)H-dependent flavin oxidoreductase YrpB (nitropropane dioxygenase family)